MEILAFEGPDGELVIKPTAEEVIALIDPTLGNWLGSSGSAYVGWIELKGTGYTTNFKRPTLHFIVSGADLVQLLYIKYYYEPGVQDLRLSSFNPTMPENRLIEHYLGGESNWLPMQSFLSHADAASAIRQFIATENLPQSVKWRRQIEVTYEGMTFGEEVNGEDAGT